MLRTVCADVSSMMPTLNMKILRAVLFAVAVALLLGVYAAWRPAPLPVPEQRVTDDLFKLLALAQGVSLTIADISLAEHEGRWARVAITFSVASRADAKIGFGDSQVDVPAGIPLKGGVVSLEYSRASESSEWRMSRVFLEKRPE